MHSPGLWLGCERGSPAPAPHFPHCILTLLCAVNHRESWKFYFFFRKKKGCLFWSFNFVSNQWAGPARCAAACLLGPTGMAVGKAELNSPSSSSQPLRQVRDRQMQPPWAVGRARGPALPGQPQLGSQALAGLDHLSSCLSYLPCLIPEVHFGGAFIELFCFVKMLFTSFSEFYVMHILTYFSLLWTLV